MEFLGELPHRDRIERDAMIKATGLDHGRSRKRIDELGQEVTQRPLVGEAEGRDRRRAEPTQRQVSPRAVVSSAQNASAHTGVPMARSGTCSVGSHVAW